MKTFQQFLDQYYDTAKMYTFINNPYGPFNIELIPNQCGTPCKHVYPILNKPCNGTVIRIFNNEQSTTVCPFNSDTGTPTLIKIELTNERW